MPRLSLRWFRIPAALLSVACPIAAGDLFAQGPLRVASEKRIEFERGEVGAQLVEATSLTRADQARATYDVDGTGLTIAVLDTGINAGHVDFEGRLKGGRNFSIEDSGDPDIYVDREGQGSSTAGIAMAKGTLHTGIAPGASVYAMKVLNDDGFGDFVYMRDALTYLRARREELGVTVVNISVGDGDNWTNVPNHSSVYIQVQGLINALRSDDVVVCVSAGGEYYAWGDEQGMGFPAICQSSTSVSAVYDSDFGGYSYFSGAEAYSTGPKRIAPFSQRLHSSRSAFLRTDIFAPGAPMTAPGASSPTASQVSHGTGQAAPVVAGVALLMQEYHLRRRGTLPTVTEIETWMRDSAQNIVDGDDEDDNVANTGQTYPLVDALAALQEVHEATPDRRPVAQAGSDIVVTTSSERGVRVKLNGTQSSDPDGRPLKFSWRATGVTLSGKKSATPSGRFPVGTKNAVLTVTDAGGLRDNDTVRVRVKLKNGKPRPRGAEANLAFDEAERLAGEALADSAGAQAATGLVHSSLAIGYGDAAGEFVRWEEGESETDALYHYVELRSLQTLHGLAATEALLFAYAETSDERLLSAAGYAAQATASAAADANEP